MKTLVGSVCLYGVGALIFAGVVAEFALKKYGRKKARAATAATAPTT